MSKTTENIEAAFAGESQARNKYTYFAEVARTEPPPKCPGCKNLREYYEPVNMDF